VDILDDRLFTRDVIKMIEEDCWSVEYAVSSAINRVIQMFERSNDDYFKGRITDMKDVGRKLLRNLLGKTRKDLRKVNHEHIVIAYTLDPHDVIVLKEQQCAGFVLETGTKTSHVALAAQGLDIPSIVGTKDITSEVVEDGDMIIIDGFSGVLILHPSEETLKRYIEQQKKLQREKEKLIQLKTLPAETIEHHRIAIVCNIDSPKEVEKVIQSSAEGIGLFRTEYQYTERNTLPTEEELYEDYKYVAEKIYPYPVVIRTFDIGADKLSRLGLEGIVPEPSPTMGLRGIRLALKYPDIFKTQLRAILRASKKRNVKVMFPLISKIEEIEQIKKIIQEVKRELKEHKVDFDENLPVGVMIETPSAALSVDVIIQKVDFISIGTNDLIQYTLAVDRFNENVAELYEPLHLSILRLIKYIVDTASKKNKPVSICGEMAADVSFTKVLVGLGIDELSVPPVAVLKIKKIIRSISYSEAKDLIEEIFSSDDYTKIVNLLKSEKIKY
ncbi:MAG: phosphoenolpyruvate--protein phosphotransferase, partial [Endomicrobia bacterium]|nr:phosphoenolpyruvate--protein phosphotransferase [Endomicrobiia bacterium]